MNKSVTHEVAPLLHTMNDTGRLLSVSRRTVQRLIERSELATVGTHKMKRVPFDSIVDYLSRHRSDKTVDK